MHMSILTDEHTERGRFKSNNKPLKKFQEQGKYTMRQPNPQVTTSLACSGVPAEAHRVSLSNQMLCSHPLAYPDWCLPVRLHESSSFSACVMGHVGQGLLEYCMHLWTSQHRLGEWRHEPWMNLTKYPSGRLHFQSKKVDPQSAFFLYRLREYHHPKNLKPKHSKIWSFLNINMSVCDRLQSQYRSTDNTI